MCRVSIFWGSILSVGVCLLVTSACDEPGGATSIPTVQNSPTTLADSQEDDVRHIERHLARLARQIREMSLQGVAEFFPEAFEGSPLLAEPPAHRRLDTSIAGIRIQTWEREAPTQVSRRQIVEAFAGFLEPVATIDHVQLKIASGRREADRFEAQVKFVLDATLRSGGLEGIKARYAARFEWTGSGWRIVGLARVSGRRARAEPPVFLDTTAAMGLTLDDYPDRLQRDRTNLMRQPFSFLGGIAVGDVDGDGLPDVLINRIGERRLFRNLDGRRFEDVTREARVWSSRNGSGALFFDYDNDGDLDLLALSYAPEISRQGSAMTLYRNDGAGIFEDVTVAAGMNQPGPAMSAAAADIDLDGDLDLYVVLYSEPLDGRLVYPRDVFNAGDAPPNRLWINNGDSTFTDRAREAGVGDTGWGFAAAFGDYNDDRLPDLYVANDFGPNRLYRNEGSGMFKDVSAAAGVADVGFGMGVDWGDYDGDGLLDLYVANMYSTAGNRILKQGADRLTNEQHRQLLKAARGNTLLRNQGDGTFKDVTATTGVGPAGWAWDVHFLDYDNDGWQDLYAANGFITGESQTDF